MTVVAHMINGDTYKFADGYSYRVSSNCVYVQTKTGETVATLMWNNVYCVRNGDADVEVERGNTNRKV